ncbi:hypothetical protein J1N35_001251 [Gossypium stocksii]|uniref:Uncharacterized protein n=1 Tax=Gossypium stocksii TaxID=47602 RepID=A0A9D4ALJ0_9ROSI|nr:hypothetical protein J1N35_001251 [Gossypium stocksii]
METILEDRPIEYCDGKKRQRTKEGKSTGFGKGKRGYVALKAYRVLWCIGGTLKKGVMGSTEEVGEFSGFAINGCGRF